MGFTKSAPSLNTLPVEILCHLFSFLPALPILRCTSTCRYLRKVLDDSSALQYAIELEAQKMVEVAAPDATSSPAERLEILRNQMSSWRAFKPTIVNHFEQPGGEVSMSFGNFTTWDDEPQIAQIRALDSGPSDSQSYRRWDASSYPMPKDTPFRVHSVCMDPSQDLFAFVVLEPNHMAEISCRIYLETLSTSEPHPLAASEILTSFKPHISANCTFDQTKIKLKIWGDRIVLFNFCDEYFPCPARMQIWNWQERQDFKCVYREQEPYGKMDDCCIVNRDHLIVSSRMTGRLPCRLSIFSFSDLAKPPVRIAECVLPFQPEATFLRHSPFVTISPDVRRSMAPQDIRFYPNAENQLIAFNIDGPPSLVFIIDTDKLLTACQSSVHIEGQSRVFPWKEWGPNCSRCIVDPIPNSLYVLRLEVAGCRAIHAAPNDVDCTSYSLHAYDFNKYRISRAAASEDFRGRIITGPTTIKHQQLKEEIVTNLPYMVVEDEGRIETAANMIDVTFDDEHILIIKSSERDENEFVIDVAKPSTMTARRE
ncbi:hypothetical protein DEU56DRAFT_774406 [Suillus clintonianus]|uniref:uncharacterized protein n=1 Tax=Suillus clintonianus TaxID=1904413 RepID=UPI001B86F8A9|nr:uncharacterized protein DEU56DRAFT_774406 [Suillus clintonianus]KAG2153308.1 hypothetical protein DEU56DRAFT_774406 [Suillus clintonianus]